MERRVRVRIKQGGNRDDWEVEGEKCKSKVTESR